ncbi:MAG: hypothetical protein L6V93_14730 [Clostridiales bacterium]|nr:MAG: hypothetical protein L6V93_14730 [Clostridiales bacterium]
MFKDVLITRFQNSASKCPTIQKLRVVGTPLKESFIGQFGMTEEESDKALEYYRALYREKGMLEWDRLFDGIDTLIKDMHDAGYLILLGSSNADRFLR